MIQVYNTSKLFQEFHKISKNKVCHLQLTTRYVNDLSFQNFLLVEDMNAKKDFLNTVFFLKNTIVRTQYKCIQQHSNIETDKAVLSVIECF